jgi:hypothetical protein
MKKLTASQAVSVCCTFGGLHVLLAAAIAIVFLQSALILDCCVSGRPHMVPEPFHACLHLLAIFGSPAC